MIDADSYHDQKDNNLLMIIHKIIKRKRLMLRRNLLIINLVFYRDRDLSFYHKVDIE